jgi:hypothetical protein
MPFGSMLGSLLGSIGSKLIPIPGVDGGQLGAALGGLSGFRTGGKVGGKRGAPVVILAHGSETVIPLNARVTKAQKKIIASNKRKAKKGQF